MSHLSRTRKRFAAWLCLAMMLFAQGAYAAHACVAMDAALDAATASLPCHQQQESQVSQAEEAQTYKNLCQNHCLAGQQILDLSKLPALAPSMLPVLFVPQPADDAMQSASPGAEVPAHPGAPPLAVLNCCFRI